MSYSLGKFTLLEHLGTGGMGQVWRATDAFGNQLAIKMLNSGAGGITPDQIRRFQREAQVMTKLHHRNLCRIHEVGSVDGLPFIALDYIEGASLAEVLHHRSHANSQSGASSDLTQIIHDVRRSKCSSYSPGDQVERAAPAQQKHAPPVPLQQALAIVLRVGEAVQTAHEAGVLHRDLKPGNIMLRLDGDPVVMDFGLAKLDHSEMGEEDLSLSLTGQIFGTIDYMAPEQALSSKDIDERADLYSLGAILYQLLTGHKHFSSTGNLLADAQALQTHEPTRPRLLNPLIDVDLETIVLKALRADPASRYRNVLAFTEDLQRYLRGEVILAREPSLREVIGKWVKRNRPLAIVSAGAAAALLLGTAIAFFNINHQRLRALQAQQEAEAARLAAQQSAEIAKANEARALTAELQAQEALQRLEAQQEQLRLARTRAERLVALYEAEKQAKGEALKKIDEASNNQEAQRANSIKQLLNKVRGEVEKGQFISALEDVRELLRLDPDSVQGWLLKAYVHLGLFELNLASDALRQTYRLNRTRDQLDRIVQAYYDVWIYLPERWEDREFQLALARTLLGYPSEHAQAAGRFLANHPPRKP